MGVRWWLWRGEHCSRMITWALTLVVVVEVVYSQAPDPNFAAEYLIQTDLGDDRFFRFQTHSGQYRKEVLKPDGSQEGTYGWVDPNGVLRLYDYIADNQGYRIVKESLFKVGQAAPGATLATRGGDLQLGFEVYPLDGSPASVGRLGGGGLPATRLHLTEGSLQSTQGYTVSSLTSTSHHLNPNPISKHEGATFFSGEPAPPAPRRIVVGAEAAVLPAVPEDDSFVVGHTGRQAPAPRAPAARTGIVIGLSGSGTAASSRAAPVRTAPPRARSGIVIGSTRRRRAALLLL